MTEAEWVASTDPWKMLEHFRGSIRPRARKLRLVAVACCRRIWHMLPDSRSRRVVELAEQLADGLADQEELAAAIRGANRAHDEAFRTRGKVGASPEWAAVFSAAPLPFFAATRASNFAHVSAHNGLRSGPEQSAQADLIRDIFGNPFHPTNVDPSWQRWNGRVAVALAQQMYDSRDFSTTPLLADMLEDAGCTEPQVLDHLRGPGPHVRGCWVVDLILGKS